MRVKRCLSLLMSVIIILGILTIPFSSSANSGQITRDTVLVLDESGSMSGDPLVTLQQAAVKFCTSLFASKGANRIALVFYDSNAGLGCDFTSDISVLTTAINSMYSMGNTNMISAIDMADEILKNSTASVRNIVLMTDGNPNEGTSTPSGPYTSADYEYYDYANSVYQKAVSLHPIYSIYTLGFFHSLQDADKIFATRFLKDLQNAGYYEVTDVNKLVFTFGEIANDIVDKKITGKFKYSSGASKDYSSTYYYDDNYFAQKSNVYSPSLATMSLCLAMSAGGSNETPSYKTKSINAENLLDELGYADFATNDFFKTKPTADSIGVLAANKKISANGNVYTIIAVAVRGGGYEMEWASNFTIGESGLHSGFNEAKINVVSFLKKYIKDKNITGDVKLWITGYSRAAATANLVAGALDNGDSLSKSITLKSEDLFSYCFECPAGLEPANANDKTKFGNIFNIINHSDPVPQVAPAAMNFGRYGVDKVLPSPETINDYSAAKKVFLEKYNTLEGVSKYVVDDFAMKKFDLYHLQIGPVSVPTVPVIEDDKENPISQGIFIDQVLGDLVKGNKVDRSLYYTLLQSGVRDVIKIGYKDGPKLPAAALIFVNKVLQNYNSLYINFLIYGADNLIATYLVESFDEAGIKNYDHDALKTAAKPLLDILLAFGTSHPNLTATLVYNVLFNGNTFQQAHFSEICLAWLMSQDVNYTTGAGQEFSNGSYRIIRINCPVDVSVLNQAGQVVASIVSESPQPMGNSSIIASINEDGEKVIYLPADSGYDLKITATNNGEVTYSVNEYSFEAGEVNRLVNYYSVPVTKNDVLSGDVPAYSKTYLKNGTVNGTNTAYKLLDANGKVIKPDLDVAGTKATNAYYKVSAVSENVKKGIAIGSGVHQVGNYAEVQAVSNKGYIFEGWYQNNKQISTEAIYRFCVKNNVNLVAKFKQSTGLLYALTVSSSKGGEIETGTSGDFAGGTVIELKATPDKGYRFKNWTTSNGGVLSSSNGLNTRFTMPENSTSVKAIFEKESSGLPFWVILVIILSVLLIAAIIALTVVLMGIKTKTKSDNSNGLPAKEEDEGPLNAQYERLNLKQMENSSIISILSGSMEGYSIPIKDGETLNFGKDARFAHVIFAEDYKMVSRIHCTISYNAKLKKYFVTDCSKNGTYRINGEKLEKGRRVAVGPNSVLLLADASCSILLI